MEKSSFHLNWYAFLISFALGITYVYFTNPVPKAVFKYPNPYNAGKVVYQNEGDACYIYSAEKVTCTADSIKQPIN